MGLAALSASAWSLSVLPINLGKIVEYTGQGFVGNAISTNVVHTPQGWADQITFEVTEPIIGTVKTGERITWFQVRSSEQVRMPGLPQYINGSSYAIFLADKAPGSQLQAPSGVGQGSFALKTDASGNVTAQNDNMNSSLFKDLDTAALSTAIAEKMAAGKTKEAKAEVASKTQSQMNVTGGPVSLDVLKNAAKTLKESGAPETKFSKKSGAGNNIEILKVN